MKNSSKKDIQILFSNICCSRCKNDFDYDSVKIIERYGDLCLCKLSCQKCGKDFGTVVFNFNRKSKTRSPLEIIDGPPPITSDDVINAHRFIKENL